MNFDAKNFIHEKKFKKINQNKNENNFITKKKKFIYKIICITRSMYAGYNL